MFYKFLILFYVLSCVYAEDDFPDTAQLSYNQTGNNVTGTVTNLPQAKDWEITIDCQNVICKTFQINNALSTNLSLHFDGKDTVVINGTESTDFGFHVTSNGSNNPILRITNQRQEDDYLSFGCLNDELKLKCPAEQVIQIEKALYGRRTKDKHKYNCAPKDQCYENKPDAIKAACIYRNSCNQIKVTEINITCNDTSKANTNLLIAYSCYNDTIFSTTTTKQSTGNSNQATDSNNTVTYSSNMATNTERSSQVPGTLVTVTDNSTTSIGMEISSQTKMATISTTEVTFTAGSGSTTVTELKVTTDEQSISSTGYSDVSSGQEVTTNMSPARSSVSISWLGTTLPTIHDDRTGTENFGMILGLSIGGGLLFLLLTSVVACFCWKNRLSQRKDTAGNRFEPLSSSLPGEIEVFPSRGEAVFINKYEEIEIVRKDQNKTPAVHLYSFMNPQFSFVPLKSDKVPNGEENAREGGSPLYSQPDKRNKVADESPEAKELQEEEGHHHLSTGDTQVQDEITMVDNDLYSKGE
ncbi:uncharacterized protein LOC106153257 [Lingula anatina]|uniref:Uncharacterized protein LOC106153257 n=1 Tax=Lingula anatina TaxID=7574 RepID=A0A1S3HBQ6_LINAN|nr:uncharacterized protein LOC106153257 [Lingula anatina]|eukprot:XP_013382569.1 uncharacterized protein LOC106153257 [Lingula anatina]